MARKIRAEQNVTENASKQARKNAEAKMGGKKPTKTKAPVILEALATDEDMRRIFDRITHQETKYAAAKTSASAMRSEAKQKLDKSYTDGAAELVGRGITKRDLKELYEESRRDPDEAVVATKAKTWAARALGLPGALQLSFWDEPVKNDKQGVERAERQGREAGATAMSVTDNPYSPGTPPGQAWLTGWHAGQASNAPGRTGDSDKVASLADAKKRKAKKDDPADDTVKAQLAAE